MMEPEITLSRIFNMFFDRIVMLTKRTEEHKHYAKLAEDELEECRRRNEELVKELKELRDENDRLMLDRLFKEGEAK